MKKTFLKFFAAVLMVGFAAVSVGCKDYDDDIESLNSAVAGLQQTISSLQSQINNGKTISSVTNTADGVTVTLSDGSTFTINHGKNGNDGAAGGAGSSSVWTIGDDGFWYENGEKTDVKAVGTDGEDGLYYVPVTDKESDNYGTWQVYQSGKPVEPAEFTAEKWLGEGVLTAVKNGNKLTFYNVEGAEGGVDVVLGGELGSLVFDPEIMDATTHFPTTKNPFYFVNKQQIVKAPFQKDGSSTVTLGNVVTFPYYVNPAEAYVETEAGLLEFITQTVETRAKNQKTDVLKVKRAEVEGGVLTVAARLNNTSYIKNEATGDETGKQYTLTALRAWNGTCPVTSDFVQLQPQAPVKPVLGKYKASQDKDGVSATDWVDGAKLTGYETSDRRLGYKLAELLNATTASSFETSKYIASVLHANGSKTTSSTYVDIFGNAVDNKFAASQGMELLDEPATTKPEKGTAFTDEDYFTLYYNNGAGSLDLNELVRFYAQVGTTYKTLESIGFEEVSYKFSLPKEFYPTKDSDAKTNQQEFIQLNDGVVTVTPAYGTAAAGKTPVVRVDGYINDKWVASAYIVIYIEKEGGVSDTLRVPFTYTQDEIIYNYIFNFRKDASDKYAQGNARDGFLLKNYNHESKSGSYLVDGVENIVAEMSYQDISKEIYAKLGLKPAEFWDKYDDSTINVKLTVEADNNQRKAANKLINTTDIYATPSSNDSTPLSEQYDLKDGVLTLADVTAPAQTTLTDDLGLQRSSNPFYTGVEVMIDQWNSKVTTETSRIRVSVSSKVLTQHTFSKYDEGAKYTVTITVSPKKNVLAPAVVLSHTFFVKHDHDDVLNFANYQYKADAIANFVEKSESGLEYDQTKHYLPITGEMTEAKDAWKIAQEFQKLFWQSNLDAALDSRNVEDAKFWWNNIGSLNYENGGWNTLIFGGDAETTAYPTISDTGNVQTSKSNAKWAQNTGLATKYVGLAQETETGKNNMLMWRSDITRILNYNAALINKETCNDDFFYVVFWNPFKAVATNEKIELTDYPETQSAHLGKGLKITQNLVIDTEKDILVWDDSDKVEGTSHNTGKVFVLQTTGKSGYGLSYDRTTNDISATNSFELFDMENGKVMACTITSSGHDKSDDNHTYFGYEVDPYAGDWMKLYDYVGNDLKTRLTTANHDGKGEQVSHVDGDGKVTNTDSHKEVHCGMIEWTGSSSARLQENYTIYVTANMNIANAFWVSAEIPVTIVREQ